MLLDLEIRAATHGTKSLDDVMRLMYRKFYESPATSYYLHGRGYTEADILNAVNQVSGADFAPFFQKYVAGTAPLPYNETFAKAGLALHIATSAKAPPSLGVLVEPVDTGDKIFSVMPGGAADRAGLSRDDILISVDINRLQLTRLRTGSAFTPQAQKSCLKCNVENRAALSTFSLTRRSLTSIRSPKCPMPLKIR